MFLSCCRSPRESTWLERQARALRLTAEPSFMGKQFLERFPELLCWPVFSRLAVFSVPITFVIVTAVCSFQAPQNGGSIADLPRVLVRNPSPFPRAPEGSSATPISPAQPTSNAHAPKMLAALVLAFVLGGLFSLLLAASAWFYTSAVVKREKAWAISPFKLPQVLLMN